MLISEFTIQCSRTRGSFHVAENVTNPVGTVRALVTSLSMYTLRVCPESAALEPRSRKPLNLFPASVIFPAVR